MSDVESAKSSDRWGQAVLKTILLTDLVDSTKMVQTLGDRAAAEIWLRHDELARDLLKRHNGLEIDKTDGFLFLFDRPIDAVGYALQYHHAVAHLAAGLAFPLAARAGIHLGEVVLRENRPEDVARGARRLDLEGLAKPVAARIMSLAGGGQTLLTKAAFDIARHAAIGHDQLPTDVRWLDHGAYNLKGVDEPLGVFEVGCVGRAPLLPPPDSEKVRRVLAAGEEETLGWRPAPGLEVPGRSNWRLARRLGVGGFGEVWLTEHERTREQRTFKFCFQADRLRSLKRELTLFRVMKEALGDRQDIARLYDVRLDEPPYFLEMEYSAGGDLMTWAESIGGITALPLEQRLDLVAQVADALSAAHSVGVLHKDIKPANVLIQEIKDVRPSSALRVQARLTDFGIGQLLSRTGAGTAGITLAGFTEPVGVTEISSRSGTQLYMAPELLADRPSTIQSDIYSLGVLLYQMATGDLRRPLGQGWERDIEDDLLREDVAACVAGQPEHRLPAADALARRLRSREQRKTERAATERRASLEKRRGRQLRWLTLSAAALLVIAGIAAIGYWQAEKARRRAVAAETEQAKARQAESDQRRLAEQSAAKAEAVNDFLQNMLASASPEMAQGRQVTVTDVLDQAGKEVEDGSLREQPEVEMAVRTTIGNTYRSRGQYEAAEKHLRAALAIAERLSPEPTLDLSKAVNNLAVLLQDQGKLEEAEPLLRRSLQIRRGLKEQNAEAIATAINNLAVFLQAQGKLAEAEPLSREVLKLQRERLGNENPTVATAMNNLAWTLQKLEKLDDAETMFREALAIRRKALGEEHPDVADSLNGLGSLLYFKSDYSSAEPLLRQALALRRKVLGLEHPAVATSLNNLAAVLEEKGEIAEAVKCYGEAIAIRRKLPGEHPSVVSSLRYLARLHAGRSEYAAAEPLFREAAAILRELKGDQDPEVADTLAELAAALAGKGDNDAAESGWREVLVIRRRALPAGHPDTAVAMLALGRRLTKQRKYDEAEALLLEGYAALTNNSDAPAELRARSIEGLTRLYEAWDKPAQATEWRGKLPTSPPGG